MRIPQLPSKEDFLVLIHLHLLIVSHTYH